MSALITLFQEQLNQLKQQKKQCKAELLSTPKGYISKKNIRGRTSYYLQWREGNKILSKYIPCDSVDTVKAQIEKRKQLEKTIQQLTEDQKRLEKVLR